MPTTAQTIIDGAYAKSVANDPGVQATPTELLGAVLRRLKELYARAAKINPLYFGASAAVVPAGSAWARPADAITVVRVENAAGTEVHVVPLNDRTQAELAPRIYRLGASYRSVGQTGDPLAASDTLTFYYAKRHPTLADEDVEFDATWVEEHNELLMTQLAIYLALKDHARGDLEALKREETDLVALFEADVEQADVGTRGRFQRPTGYSRPGPQPAS